MMPLFQRIIDGQKTHAQVVRHVRGYELIVTGSSGGSV
jgi:hypothetical protein